VSGGWGTARKVARDSGAPPAKVIGLGTQATRAGRCKLCDNSILPGQRIVNTVGFSWVHVACRRRIVNDARMGSPRTD
jgi:hypothetical protein